MTALTKQLSYDTHFKKLHTLLTILDIVSFGSHTKEIKILYFPHFLHKQTIDLLSRYDAL